MLRRKSCSGVWLLGTSRNWRKGEMQLGTAGVLTAGAPQQQRVILRLTSRVRAPCAPRRHFSSESQKGARFSNAAQLVQGWVRTCTKANILPHVLGARAPGERAAAVAPPAPRQGGRGRSHHGRRQGGFLLARSCRLGSAFEAVVGEQGWQSCCTP